VIGLDSNVIVRYAVRDDPQQAAQADAVFDGLSVEAPGYVSVAALVETVWVLARAYRFPRASVLAFIGRLIESADLVFDHGEAVRRAVRMALAKASVDLPDAIIAQVGLDAGCAATVTFDRRARAIPGMRVLAGAR
jgi:predicted nucleic-acid-binding protein